ncbi:MAG: hypothetical protein LBL42_04100, partial [Tannerella sp.]|nr:hypothetical protein [Tannerella sp.]
CIGYLYTVAVHRPSDERIPFLRPPSNVYLFRQADGSNAGTSCKLKNTSHEVGKACCKLRRAGV